jgi:D-amino-acid dehydrogenase
MKGMSWSFSLVPDSDVLIIGGGAVGLCSAYYLNAEGLTVTVVEEGKIGSGCSSANAGLIVPSHSIPLAAPGVLRQGFKWIFKRESPFYIRPPCDRSLITWLWKFKKASTIQQMHKGLLVLLELGNASMRLFDRLISDESLTCCYQKNGWLLVYKTDQGFRKGVEEAHLLQKCAVDVSVLNRDETLDMAPSLYPEISGGIFFPGDSHLDPGKLVKALADCLENRGVTIINETKALKLETSTGSISNIITNRGALQPKNVILAAGAWSGMLMHSLGFRLPLQPAKGYCITAKCPVKYSNLPLYLCEAKVAVTPVEDMLRFAGTMEMSGMDLTINPHRVDAILSAVRKYIHKMEDLNIIEVSHGLRPCTPDGIPIIDRIPGFENLFIATGHCMLGITLAPITGKLISHMILGKTPDIDIFPLRMARFQ